MNERNKRLQSVIKETQKIRESIDVLAARQGYTFCYGYSDISESDSDTDTENISLDFSRESETLPSLHLDMPSFECLQQVLETTSYNWFEVVQYVEERTKCDL